MGSKPGTQQGTEPLHSIYMDFMKTVSVQVQVINMSLGFSIFFGPIDGTGIINEHVNRAVNNGIVWVNSAGNNAKAHWSNEESP